MFGINGTAVIDYRLLTGVTILFSPFFDRFFKIQICYTKFSLNTLSIKSVLKLTISLILSTNINTDIVASKPFDWIRLGSIYGLCVL